MNLHNVILIISNLARPILKFFNVFMLFSMFACLYLTYLYIDGLSMHSPSSPQEGAIRASSDARSGQNFKAWSANCQVADVQRVGGVSILSWSCTTTMMKLLAKQLNDWQCGVYTNISHSSSVSFSQLSLAFCKWNLQKHGNHITLQFWLVKVGSWSSSVAIPTAFAVSSEFLTMYFLNWFANFEGWVMATQNMFRSKSNLRSFYICQLQDWQLGTWGSGSSGQMKLYHGKCNLLYRSNIDFLSCLQIFPTYAFHFLIPFFLRRARLSTNSWHSCSTRDPQQSQVLAVLQGRAWCTWREPYT